MALHYVWTILAVMAVTFVGKVLKPMLNPTNVALLYLLPVLVSATRWGWGPSFFAAFLSVLAFDFFFVPPMFSFTVNEPADLFIFAVYLIVALVTGTMATKLRTELEKSKEREERTAALYEISRQIAAEADLPRILETLVKTISDTIDARVSILMAEAGDGNISRAASYPPQDLSLDGKEQAVAQWVLKHGLSAGKGTDVLREASGMIFPVKTEETTLAVLAIEMNDREKTPSEGQRRLIEAFANLAAIAIIRVRLAKEAEQAKWLAESEKLHRALLDSVSHDMRTPLAAITGAVTSLISKKGAYDEGSRDVLLGTIKEEARRMNRFIGNLLDMVRLESGILKPKSEWCDVQDIVGVVLRATKETLQQHRVSVYIPPDLPPIKADFVLMEQVMVNLLENAAKYSPGNSEISISAQYADHAVRVTVADSGPPIPAPDRERVFDKFYRLHSSRHVSGSGLGLSICKGIIEAQGGTIRVDSSSGSGNRFIFAMPVPDGQTERPNVKEGEENVT